MAVSLVATWQPDSASALLTVVGSTWTTVPATVTVTRKTAATPETKVRGIIGKPVIGGYLVATDHEMDLNTSVTYTITGYSALGAMVESGTATVNTTAATDGVWLKAPGRPDLTAFCQPASLGDVSSQTIGGVHQVIGGDAVAVAQWSGVAALSAGLTLRAERGAEVAKLKTLLQAARVLLVQPVGWSDLDAGWYYASSASWQNPGGFDAFTFRLCTLALQSVGVPAGQQSGGTWTYAISTATWATYAASKAAHSSYFARSQGQ